MTKDIYAVVLCGGSGTRLWPVSRKECPKQFLSFESSGRSLLVQTVDRLKNFAPKDRTVIVSGVAHEAEARRQVGTQVGHFMVEPVSRNTAPAIALCAKRLLDKNPNALMVVLPSDHYIENISSFEKTLQDAVHLAESNYFVVIGVEPTAPATNFGYIEIDDEVNVEQSSYKKDHADLDFNAHHVRSFHEKPSVHAAEQYLRTGKYLWNAGMFVWKAKNFWDNFCQLQPKMAEMISSINDTNIAEIYPQLENVSIDVAFLEKASRIVCVPARFAWDDLGSWSAVKDCFVQDSSGNTLNGDVFVSDTSNSLVQSSGPFVSVVGLENVIVVATKDAVLVTHVSKDQDVKKIIAYLETKNRSLL